MMIGNPAVKRRLHRRAVIVALCVLCAAPAAAFGISARIHHDEFTGLAISGFDPVAYFIDGVPRRGEPEHETVWQGGYWHFVNEGNQAAFEATPEVYAPAFGGYGLAGMARGIVQESNPEIFAVHRNRLFLFYDRDDVQAFRSDPDAMIEAADGHWPTVSALLPE